MQVWLQEVEKINVVNIFNVTKITIANNFLFSKLFIKYYTCPTKLYCVKREFLVWMMNVPASQSMLIFNI